MWKKQPQSKSSENTSILARLSKNYVKLQLQDLIYINIYR